MDSFTIDILEVAGTVCFVIVFVIIGILSE